MDDAQVKLVELADRLATTTTDQPEADYLKRFRAFYRHMNASVTARMTPDATNPILTMTDAEIEEVVGPGT
jgi:hypothetical protein